jgi:hypothetical protein
LKGELAEQAIMSKKNVLKQYFVVEKDTQEVVVSTDTRKKARTWKIPNHDKIVRVEIDLKTMQATAKVVR